MWQRVTQEWHNGEIWNSKPKEFAEGKSILKPTIALIPRFVALNCFENDFFKMICVELRDIVKKIKCLIF